MPFKNGHVLEFTATFHSYRVNHSSNPKGRANLSAYQLHTPIILRAAPAATAARIRHIPQVLARPAVSPDRKEPARRSELNPRVEAEHHVFERSEERRVGKEC